MHCGMAGAGQARIVSRQLFGAADVGDQRGVSRSPLQTARRILSAIEELVRETGDLLPAAFETPARFDAGRDRYVSLQQIRGSPATEDRGCEHGDTGYELDSR